VAARAARAGAEVTGIDLAPGMIEKARQRPEPVRWEVGDVQALPYRDGAFEVVSSCFGAIFAPDPERAAAELTRVGRGRIGVTSWEPHPEQEIWKRYLDGPVPTDRWSTEESLRQLLAAFELEVEHGVWFLEGESADAVWDWTSRAFPPMRERLRRMAPDQVEAARSDVAELHERYREDGRIRYPRPYLLAVGRKR
jgi:hypothetical protein